MLTLLWGLIGTSLLWGAVCAKTDIHCIEHIFKMYTSRSIFKNSRPTGQ